MNVEPVAVVSVTDTNSLRRAVLDATAIENRVVPKPLKGNWPAPVVPRYAGVKTWSAFARDASAWDIKEISGKYQIAGYRMHEKEYWVEDHDQRCEFPLGASIDTVIDCMIAILQDAAKNQKTRRLRRS